MGKTRYIFKKIRDTKGTFHAKMGSVKDRNAMDLTEAEDIKYSAGNSDDLCTVYVHRDSGRAGFRAGGASGPSGRKL